MKSDWPTASIGESCIVSSGGTPSRSKAAYWNGDLPWVSAKDLKADQIQDAELHISKAAVEQSATKIAPEGSLLVLVRGMGLANGVPIGEVVSPVAFNQDIRAIKPPKGVIPRFLLLALRNTLSNGGRESIISSAAHGTLKIDADMLSGIRFPVPSLSEQQRIVGILDKSFEAIDIAKANAEKNHRNARAVFESVMDQVFVGRGEGWVERALDDICVVDWGNTDLTKSSYVPDGEFLAVSASGGDGRINHREHAAFTPVLSAIGAQCGRMFLPKEDFTAIKNTITLTPRSGLSTGSFLFRLLTHVELPKRGAAQPFIAKGDIKSFRVEVPTSISMQETVCRELDAVEDESNRLAAIYQAKLATLDSLRTSLLHQAFSRQL